MVYDISRLLHNFYNLWRYFKFLRHILCKKYYVFLFKKSLIYAIPNTWFLHAHQQKIKNGGFYRNLRLFTKLVEPLITRQSLEEMFW